MTDIKYCFVPICSNNSKKAARKLFITVPKNKTRRMLWFQAVGLKKITESHNVYCCEDHFKLEEDADNWMYFKTIGHQIKIKNDVVPHINISKVEKIQREDQVTNSTKKRKLEALEVLRTSSQNVKKKLFEEEASTSALSPARTNIQTQVYSPSGYFDIGIQHRDQGVQVNIVPPKRSIGVNATQKSKQQSEQKSEQTSSALKVKALVAKIKPVALQTHGRKPLGSSSASDSSPQSEGFGSQTSATSATSSSGSSSGYEPVTPLGRKESTLFLIKENSRFYLGLPPDTYELIKLLNTCTSVQYRDILITLKKIRLNDAYVRLGHDFELSASQISRIFTGAVPKLADQLQELIFWPVSNEIKRLLPLPFRARFSDVESIIDCLEIQIERPSNALRQAMTWSQYKNCNTIKYLISATPNGVVNFISGGYGGRTSDIQICEQSNYFDLLRPGTSVMADRGFKGIDLFLRLKGCKLVRPPSVSAGEKLSKLEVRMNKRIASLRVHVERVISRLREFSMCEPHAVGNHDILYLMNHIVLITCAIINLQGPLIK